MSILSTIKDFATNVFGVEKSPSVNSARKSEGKPPVIQCENPGENTDTLEIKNKDKQMPPTAPQKRSLGQIKQSIKLKCTALGIDYAKISRKIGYIAGLSKEDFDNLPPEAQEKVLNMVEHELDKYAKIRQQYGSSPETGEVEAITESAKNKYEAVESGDFDSIEEVEAEAGDVNADLGKDFKKSDIKERRQRMDKLAQRRKEIFEARMQKELSKLPESERAEAATRMRRRFRFAEHVRFHEIVATNDSETGLNAIAMLPADDMSYGVRKILKTRVDKAEATRTADMAKFDFTEGLMKSYYERGEKPDAAVIKDYTQTTVAAKSKEAAFEYQNDYNKRRQTYENGEDVPPYLNEDFFTSTAQGIGEGALNNVNMTTEEKAEFVTKWENDAKQYKDYETVTSDVKKSLEEKPEYKEIAEKIEESRKSEPSEKSENTAKSTVYNDKEIVSNPISDSVTNPIKAGRSKTSAISEEEKVSAKEQKQVSSNPIVVARTIKREGIGEAIKKYSPQEVISEVLDNQNLKYLRPQLSTIIKSYDLSTLKAITGNGCSDSSFLYICSIVNKEYREELRANRQHLCYSANQQFENLEGDNV